MKHAAHDEHQQTARNSSIMPESSNPLDRFSQQQGPQSDAVSTGLDADKNDQPNHQRQHKPAEEKGLKSSVPESICEKKKRRERPDSKFYDNLSKTLACALASVERASLAEYIHLHTQPLLTTAYALVLLLAS